MRRRMHVSYEEEDAYEEATNRFRSTTLHPW
jgi:hypothetical protein